MGSVGGPEILVILVIALLVLGPERLPEAARTVGRVVREMRKMASGFQAEIRDAMREPAPGAAGSPPPDLPAGGAGPAAPPNGRPSTEPLSSGPPAAGESTGSAS